MTNSEDPAWAARWIEQTVKDLSEANLQRLVDRPLDASAARFSCDAAACTSQREFLQTLGAFVRRLYREGLGLPVHLTVEQSQSEALSLLEADYQNAWGRGYEAAYVDAVDPRRNGLGLVLAALTDILRTRQRDRCMHWLLARTLDPLQWNAKRHVVAVLLERLGPFLPPSLKDSRPEWLTDDVPLLLKTLMNSEQWPLKPDARPG